MKARFSPDALYDDVLLDQTPVTSTDSVTQNQSYRIHAETGIVEPIYLDRDDDLRDWINPVIEKIRHYFKEKLGIELDYFGDLKIRSAKLPPSRKSADGRSIEKVFGFYGPETDEMYVDEILDPENQSEEKELLQQYMDLPSMERVAGEELIHYIQKKSGVIEYAIKNLGEKARDYIEGAAAFIADEIFGATDIYNREKAEYLDLVDEFGDRGAFLGPFSRYNNVM